MKSSALDRVVAHNIEQSIPYLARPGLLDADGKSPLVDRILEQARPYFGKQVHLPADIELAIDFASRVGPAFEYQGEREVALKWYEIGQYAWTGGEHFREYVGMDALQIEQSMREAPAEAQQPAALMAALAGNILRADELFRWAARNRQLSDEEIRFHEETRQYQSVWQTLGFRVGCLTWLGEWVQALRDSTIAQRMIEKTRRAGYPKDFREPQLLALIGGRIASYHLNPTPENRQGARDALSLSKIPDRDPLTRFAMLPYLFAFRRRYPELL
ncbi:MAG: hypothetical protein ACM3JD_18060 [Rudaea sp.]